MSRYYSWDKIIPKAECERIIDDFSNIEGYKGTQITEFYGKIFIRLVSLDSLVTKLIYGFVHEANDTLFHYEITDHEQMQFIQYAVDDRLQYHQDLVYDGVEVAPVRKLSVSVLLSDPKDFEGGEFEVYGGFKEPTKPLKEQGSIVVFDSRDYHAVTPVTSGVRHSLVMWATGPLFK
jgi:PKHD-type hydroxylase